MNFASPLWLIGLAPWAALVLWLLLRRRETTGVTFLPLWIELAVRTGRRTSLGLPPVAMLLILLAIMLALLGAAGPRVRMASSTKASKPPPRATITLLSPSERPQPEVMVQIKTEQFDRPAIDLSVQSGSERTVRSVTVAPNGVQNVFVDFKSLGQMVDASLHGGPTITIARSGRPVAIADDARVPPTLRRLINIIQHRRGTDVSDAVTIGIDSSLDSSRPGIVLSPPTQSDSVHWTVMDDPLTRDVDWSQLSGGCAVDPSWKPLVFNADRVLIARRRQPPMQILTSVSTLDWPSTPSFVVFWTNAIHDLAGGDGEFERYEAPQTDLDFKPISPQPAFRDLSPTLFFSALLAILLAGIFVPWQSISYTAAHDIAGHAE